MDKEPCGTGDEYGYTDVRDVNDRLSRSGMSPYLPFFSGLESGAAASAQRALDEADETADGEFDIDVKEHDEPRSNEGLHIESTNGQNVSSRSPHSSKRHNLSLPRLTTWSSQRRRVPPVRSDTATSLGSPVVGVVDLTGRIKTIHRDPVAHGGFSDIHLGELDSLTNEPKVETRSACITYQDLLSSCLIDELSGCHQVTSCLN